MGPCKIGSRAERKAKIIGTVPGESRVREGATDPCHSLLPLLLPPVFLSLPPHGWRVRVLALDPVRRAPGTIAGIAALRNNAFEPKFASVLEYERAILIEMLIEPQPWRRARQHGG